MHNRYQKPTTDSEPSLKEDENGEIVAHHNHHSGLGYKSFRDREELKREIKKEKAHVRSCMAFFKEASRNHPDELYRAVALNAYQEDKKLKEKHESHTPFCALL